MKNLLIILIVFITSSCSSYKNAYKLSEHEKNANNYLAGQAHEIVRKNVHHREARFKSAHKKQMKLEKNLQEMNNASINRINPHQKRVKKPSPFY